jgi:lysophospholipase L1-like esterase
VVYRDEDGVERARTPHGFMYDSNVDPNSGEPAISNGVTFAIIPHGAGQALEIKLDRQWMDSKDRKWPLTVDPDTYVFTKGDDTFVMSPFTQNYSSLNELKVGKPDSSSSVARAFLHFDTSQLNGVNVTSSYLFTREKHSWSPTQNPGPAYRVFDSSWTGASMIQFPGAATDDGSPASGAWWPDGKTNPNRWAYWDITGMARSWAAAHEDNGSVSIRASNEASNLTWKKYHSANTALETTPMITVAYTAGDPFGSTDDAVSVPGYGSGSANVFVRGWGIDPDTTGSIGAHAYAFKPDGTVAAWVDLSANKQRADVGIAYPGYGDNHGYDGYIPVPGPDTYTVCVALANVGQGTSIWLPCRTVRVDNYPSTAQNAQATANLDGTVKVTWVGPASNGNSAITGFNIQAFDANGTFVAYRLCSWGCRTATFNELALGTNYTIKVYAQNAIGYSLEQAVGVTTQSFLPGAPGTPTATLDGNNVDVTWTAPAANGGSAIIRYDVRAHLASNDAAVGAEALTCAATCRSMEFTGLTAGTGYKFRIYAVNSVGPSAAAVTDTVTIPSPTGPNVPGNPQATLDGDNVDVTWTAPATGPAVASYQVQAHVASTDVAGPVETCDFPCTSAEFTGLTAGTAYKFKIYAINPHGPSVAAVTNTVDIPDGPEPTVPFAPVNVQVSGHSSQLTVTWEPAPDQGGVAGNGGSPLTGHKIVLDPVCPACTGMQVSGQTFASTVVGVSRGTSYVISVVATNAVGDSAASAPVQFSTDSDPPGSPTITDVGESDGTLSVAWDAPADSNGSVITGYELAIDPPCSGCTGLIVGNPTPLQSEISGLTNDVEYTVKVAALFVGGAGAQSDAQIGTPYRPDYVAIGDSFSSGQGAPPYAEESGNCLRSQLAYGPLFDGGAGSSFDEFKFLACAGDVVDDISGQLSQLPNHIRPGLVTLTAAGNDAHFGDVLFYCIRSFNCQQDSRYAGLFDEITDFDDRLRDLYLQAKARANAADAQVIVFAYPQLFSSVKDNDCLSDLGFEQDERVWIRSLVSHMNDVIQSTAAEVGVTVIQLSGPTPNGAPTAEPGPFDGHEICSGSGNDYISGNTLNDEMYFHPNEAGYRAMRDLLTQTWQAGLQ